MKKIFISFIALLFWTQFIFAQTGAITSSIPVTDPVFVNGVTGFNNLLSIPVADVSNGTQIVWFCSFDDNNNPLDTSIATSDGTDWNDSVDMGQVNENATSIVAQYYDAGYTLLDVSEAYTFRIKSKPSGIADTLVTINADSISSGGIAYLSIIVNSPDSIVTIDPNVIGIGGKQFGFLYNRIDLKREYDLSNGTINNTGDNFYEYQLNAFSRSIASDQIPLVQSEQLNFAVDTNLNPLITGHFSAVKNFFNYETRDAVLPLPITPAQVSIGAGINVSGGYAADCYIGLDNNGKLGFVQDPSGARSAVSIGAKMVGNVRVTGSLVNKHLAGIEASLTATGTIGASYQFQTVPQWSDSFLFGGTLQISGKVELTGIAGQAKELFCGIFSSICKPNNTVLDGVIWPSDVNNLPYKFGDGLPPNLDTLLHALYHNGYNIYARGSVTDSAALFDIPAANPQPSFGSRGSSIAVAWIETDAVNQHLLFSVLDTVHNLFTPPVEVSENDVMLSDPKVAIAPDGSAIIVWEQSQRPYNEIQAVQNLTVDTVLNDLRIWYAVYDPVSGTITSKSNIDNPVDLPASKPGVAISDSGKAIISWLAQDSGSTMTDIWYAELINGNGIWYQSVPDLINDLPGNNYSVNICFTDSVNAIATWITDPDGNDSTGGNEIVACYYDGTNWGASAAISDQNDNEQFHDLNMDFNGRYGALAYTSSTFNEDGGQLNSIKVEFFKDGIWDALNYYEYDDSDKYVNMPRVSISDMEFAAVSYQTVDMYNNDSSGVDAGEVNLALKDLNSGNGWDSVNFSTTIAQDTSIFVWDMDVALARNNKLYTLSQEEDTIDHTIYGGQYTPHTGTLFGDPSLSMVLRGLQINNDLTIKGDSTNTLPEAPTGIKQISPSISQLNLLAYPNPFKDNLTIEYAIPENGQTRMEVFDMLGRSEAVIVNQLSGPGNYKASFQAGGLGAGIYVLKLTSGNQSKTCKLVLK